MTRRTLVVACVALLGAVVALAGLRQLARSRTVQLFGRIVARVDTADSVVALTFDDGPVAARADSLIAMLGARGVHATFFVTGNESAAAPEAVRALVAAGHELGNHSYTHDRMVLRSPADLRDEIVRTDELLRAAGAREPIHFRPPFAYKLVALPWVLRRMNRTTVTWDIEPDSYAEVAATSQGIVDHVVSRVRPGSIILLHPWYPSRRTSLAAIPAMVDSLHARGYRVTTVRELLSRDRRSAARDRR